MPNFDDFIGGYNFYTEMEFTYKGIMYGLMGVENAGVEFFEIDTGKLNHTWTKNVWIC